MYNFYNRFSISSTFILTSITLIIGNSIQLSQHTYLSVIHIKSVLLDFRGSRHRVSGFLVGVLEAPGHPAAELSTVGVRNGVVEILTPLSLSLSLDPLAAGMLRIPKTRPCSPRGRIVAHKYLRCKHESPNVWPARASANRATDSIV